MTVEHEYESDPRFHRIHILLDAIYYNETSHANKFLAYSIFSSPVEFMVDSYMKLYDEFLDSGNVVELLEDQACKNVSIMELALVEKQSSEDSFLLKVPSQDFAKYMHANELLFTRGALELAGENTEYSFKGTYFATVFDCKQEMQDIILISYKQDMLQDTIKHIVQQKTITNLNRNLNL